MNRLTDTNLVVGTSFHGDTITATVQDLYDILGEPDCINNSGEEKSNFDWFILTAGGKVATVYNWKEYRPLDMHEEIVWHIGGHSASDTYSAMQELELSLSMQRA